MLTKINFIAKQIYIASKKNNNFLLVFKFFLNVRMFFWTKLNNIFYLFVNDKNLNFLTAKNFYLLFERNSGLNNLAKMEKVYQLNLIIDKDLIKNWKKYIYLKNRIL